MPPLKLSPNPLIVCYEIYYTDITHATHITRAVTLRDLTCNRCDLWGRAPPPDLLVRESITVREELGPRESVVWDVARSSGDQVVCHAVYQWELLISNEEYRRVPNQSSWTFWKISREATPILLLEEKYLVQQTLKCHRLNFWLCRRGKAFNPPPLFFGLSRFLGWVCLPLLSKTMLRA